MLHAIVEFSLRFRGIVIAIACLIVLFGLYTTEHARLGVFPEFAPPQVTIQTEAPGLSPEQVETLVMQRIENALIGTVGLQSIRSRPIPSPTCGRGYGRGWISILKRRERDHRGCGQE